MSASSKAATRKTGTRRSGARTRAAPKRSTTASGGRSVAAGEEAPSITGIRVGSKQALLVARLGEPSGARIADLTKELGWLPHTVRAALTRLRQQGYVVTRSKSEEGDTVYRAAPPTIGKRRFRATPKSAV
jgi:hypothetical protein